MRSRSILLQACWFLELASSLAILLLWNFENFRCAFVSLIHLDTFESVNLLAKSPAILG